jgi:hypothetical protein
VEFGPGRLRTVTQTMRRGLGFLFS